MKKIISIAAGAMMLSAMPSMSVADVDVDEIQKLSIVNQRELIKSQCQDQDRNARQFSTLLGPPSNYSSIFPVMGPLAGELEYIPPFRGQVLSGSFGIIEEAAKRRVRMLDSRQLYRSVYNSEKGSQKNTDWEGFASAEMQKAEQTTRDSLRYISNKAVQDVQELLNKTTVYVKSPYNRSYSSADIAKNRAAGKSDKSLTHIEKSAARVMAECRSYWNSGFEAVQGKALLQSAEDLRRQQEFR